MPLERPLEVLGIGPTADTNFDKTFPAETPVASPAKPVRAGAVFHPARLPALDGLRAFSILLVMLAHAGLARVVPGGLGVTIFFFISGLLITRLLLHEVDASGTIRLREFYIRRFLRLQPALLLYVAVAVLLLVAMGTQPYWPDIIACLLYAGNYYQIFHGEFLHPAVIAPDGHQELIQTPFGIVWSLAVEEHFYLAFPFIVAVLARSREKLFVALAAVCALALLWRIVLYSAGVGSLTIYMATDTRIDSIIYGALVAVAMSTNHGRAAVSKWLGSRTAFAAGVILLLATLAIRHPFFRDTLRYSLQGIALGPIVYSIVFGDKMRFLTAVCSHPIAVYAGKLSYSLYLYHYSAFMVASWFAVTYGFPEYGAQWLLISLPLTILGATASYHLVETKFFKLRRRFGSVV